MDIRQNRQDNPLDRKPFRTFYLTIPRHQHYSHLVIERGSKLIVSPPAQSPFLFDDQYITIKLQGDDYDSVLNSLKQSSNSFTDGQFERSDKSIEIAKREGQLGIVWKRVREMDQAAVVYDPETRMQGEEFDKTTDGEFNRAVKWLLEKKVLNRNVVSVSCIKKGLGVFKFKRNGIPRIVMVDDYLPIYRGKYVFSKPHQHDFLIPLLEKALAKLHGCYQLIPKSLPEILRSLILVPSTVYRIDHDNKIIQEVLSRYQDNWICCCRSKNPPKDYLLSMFEGKITLLSENMQRKIISSDQLLKDFCTVWLWRYNPSQSITFEQSSAQSSSYRLQISQDSDVTLALNCTYGRGFKRLLVWNQQSEFIGCSAGETSWEGSLFLEKLPRGVYFVYCEVEKYEGGKLTLTVASEHIAKIINWAIPETILTDIIHSYSLKVDPHLNLYIDEPKKSYVTVRLLYRQLGIAYIQVCLDNEFKKRIRIELDSGHYHNSGFELKPKIEGKYVKEVEPGQKLTIPFYITYNHPTVLQFPPGPSPISQIAL